ncbi:MAG: nucleotidyl transferase AbiEii/AbiGii toxin family protein [Pseudomonadota bacterium]
MTIKTYKKQVSLLLSTLPEVAKEKCFVLHGGTAINLFVRDMPRLSVDIDLTYFPIEDRATSLENISQSLERIKTYIESRLQAVRVVHQHKVSKLQVSYDGIQIKLEVNQIARGTLKSPQILQLCEKAQSEFEAFCAMPIVPTGQLYGGKICAALDRQHPRDLFDIKYPLENEGFSEEIKQGFLLCLLSSDRPLHEIINPNFQDQRLAMTNQFEGMSLEFFSYEDYENIREQLVKNIHMSLEEKDRVFLLSVKNLSPDWGIYDFEKFPAVQWKLQNLEKLKTNNPDKHQEQYQALQSVLDNVTEKRK